MEEEGARVGRRAALSGLAAALGGTAGYFGMPTSIGGRSETVSMLAAGSLNNAIENGLKPAVDATLETEAHGSAKIARLITEGQKDADIISIADIELFDMLSEPNWYAEFVTNSIVIAYNPHTDGGQQLANVGAESWYQPLLNGSISLGRTDPDLDPLGYRTLFMLELATVYYRLDINLREAIPNQNQIYPETQLISQFETGSVDAVISYRNMAIERDYEYIPLPAEINLSDPSFTEQYSMANYELPNGNVITGRPIIYGSTLQHQSPAAIDAFKKHIAGQYLEEFGFVTPADYPHYTSNAPNKVKN